MLTQRKMKRRELLKNRKLKSSLSNIKLVNENLHHAVLSLLAEECFMESILTKE